MRAHFQLILLLAQCKAPNNYGEKLVKPAIEIFAEGLLDENAQALSKKLVLHRNSVPRSISDMSLDVREQIIEGMKNSRLPVSLQQYETTDVGKCAQVMIFVRFLCQRADKSYFVHQNFLLCHQLFERSTSLAIEDCIDKAFEQYDSRLLCAHFEIALLLA